MFVNHKAAGPVLAFGCFVVLSGTLIIAYGWRAIWIIVAVPLVLVLPGVALTAAAFPRGVLSRAEQLLFALGLSLALVVLTGLALNETPWGLRSVSWVATLVSIIGIAGLVAWLRRRRAIAAPVSAMEGLSVTQAAICGLAVIMVMGAAAITVTGAQKEMTTGFTQLWLLPADDATTMNIGMTNREPAAATSYRLEFQADGRVISVWDVRLASGATWTDAVVLPADIPDTATIEAVLYRSDNDQTVYRRAKIQRRQ